MTGNINVLFLAAESEPFVKVGGLADVAGSLPPALRQLTLRQTGGFILDVRLVLPLHRAIQARMTTLHLVIEFPIYRHGGSLTARVFECNLNGLPVYFITGQPISAATSIYSSDPGQDREKYTFFSLAALEMTRRLGWCPDILHANDWHAALALYALRLRRGEPFFARMAGLLTLHNLPYMGGDASDVLTAYGLIPLTDEALPAWGRTQPLPMGLWAADAIVPVSETYAREILTPEFGCDLQDFLRSRATSITGITNGLDTALWDPARDQALATKYDVENLDSRAKNKTDLQKRLDLPTKPRTPLLAMVTRLDPQKGVDLAFEALRLSADRRWQFVILGTGDPALEEASHRLQADFPERVRSVHRFDAPLGHLIYGGADMFLMPSRYEPCGLSQMIAMRYGCVPVVHATGGLKDTVHESRTGFLFEKPTPEALSETLRRVFSVYPNPEKWERFQRGGMKQDFSWTRSARRYALIYRSLLPDS